MSEGCFTLDEEHFRGRPPIHIVFRDDIGNVNAGNYTHAIVGPSRSNTPPSFLSPNFGLPMIKGQPVNLSQKIRVTDLKQHALHVLFPAPYPTIASAMRGCLVFTTAFLCATTRRSEAR